MHSEVQSIKVLILARYRLFIRPLITPYSFTYRWSLCFKGICWRSASCLPAYSAKRRPRECHHPAGYNHNLALS